MRVSACGWAAKDLETAIELSRRVTEITHNHPDGIKGAEAVAVCIFMARQGKSIKEIRDYVDKHYYPMNFTLDEIRPKYEFIEICQETVPQAIMAFLESTSFEDAIRNAISIGGDSDTLTAITGSIAEAYYNAQPNNFISDKILARVAPHIDSRMTKIMIDFADAIGKVELRKIYTYGITIQGKAHARRGLVCQDAHCVKKVDGNFVAAAVADGVGSERYSDVASKIAVEISVTHCAENITRTQNREQILNEIRTAFTNAQSAIESEAKAKGQSLDEYDATLSVAVFLDGTLYFGHAGDSGIIALTMDGLYRKVTMALGTDELIMLPLVIKDGWTFGTVENVASVLLATDGVLDSVFCPSLLHGTDNEIYISYARNFLDNTVVQIDRRGEEEITARAFEWLNNIPEEDIDDDKTLVVLIDASARVARQPESYYEEPDWDTLEEKKNSEFTKLLERIVADKECAADNPHADKIVFLDIDGVLNLFLPDSGGDKSAFSEDSCKNLKDICDTAKAKIVLSSSWRVNKEALPYIHNLLKRYGITADYYAGQTADFGDKHSSEEFVRYLEIMDCVDSRSTQKYVIIDDMDLVQFDEKHAVQTDPYKGITDEIKKACIEKLG